MDYGIVVEPEAPPLQPIRFAQRKFGMRATRAGAEELREPQPAQHLVLVVAPLMKPLGAGAPVARTVITSGRLRAKERHDRIAELATAVQLDREIVGRATHAL